VTQLLFGINVSTSAAPEADPVADARQAEELGFDFVSASDHPCGSHPSRETWTMLTWIAASTRRIKVTTRVMGVPFRPPVLIAKMAETLDRLSSGRLILGLGAGGSENEVRCLGLRERSPRQRIDGLEDASRIIRGVWHEQPYTYHGSQYQANAAELEPKPSHRIPLWLGTFGPHALAVTGRVADGWIPTLGYAPEHRLASMRDRVRAAAYDVGRDPDEIKCILNVQIYVGKNVADPNTVSGPADEVADRLARFVDLGFSGLNFLPVGPSPRAQAERIGTEVLPLLSR
jgi:alkanesulfonate monooxygenase SsuD/methylene tetrahydromethanopterin reductase-like flavin-dependent oxidoreductase (luciferase family)